ncbi:MAG: hypothetical protein ABFD79_18315 [Phycisphaerales bacterium]
MKKNLVSLMILAVAAIASTATAAVLPSGCTGLWLFDNAANLGQATIGTDLTTNGFPTGGPGGGALNTWPGIYATNTGGMTANGGGDYVNQYTIVMDITLPDPAGWRSLLQTCDEPMGNDGDMWIASDGSVGVGANYSAEGIIPTNAWKRIVMAANLGSYFKVYVDGVEVLNITDSKAALNGDLSLYDYSVSFFADNDGEDGAVICNTLGYWNRTLSSAEISAMGNAFTVLSIPEPITLSLFGLGTLLFVRRK